MKLLLTGASGFVGKEILTQLLDNTSVTTILALSRRDLSITHPKLRVLITQDFTNYPDDIREELKNVDACIWSLGVTPSKLKNMQDARKVSIDYTRTALDILTPATKAIKFIYISGFLAERDQQKPLWIKPELRKIRGQVEVMLLEQAKQHDNFETCILRSALVLDRSAGLVAWAKSFLPSVRIDVLAAACVKAAVVGTDKQIVENAEISRV